MTSDAALDLSHSTVSGFTVASSNATGTNFTVHDIGTAFQVAGGSGTDTLTAQGFAFSADQRNAIFATASVEHIVDASGTYTVDNASPTITSNGGGDTAAVSIAENTTAVTTVTATDPDVGQTLSYSIIGGADASKFTIDSSTGALSFVTAPNFELPTDAGGNNVYDVIVQASDGHGGIDTQAIAVTVTVAAPNHIPVATASDLTATHYQIIAATALFSVADADDDTITRYQFWDSTVDASSGHWVVNGVVQGTNQAIDVTPAQLSSTTFQSGSGSDDLWVRAFDGMPGVRGRNSTSTRRCKPCTGRDRLRLCGHA